MVNIQPKTLSARLRLKRTLRGWTLRELGERSGVGYTYIWALENGRGKHSPRSTTRLTVAQCEALALALRCKPAWLAGWK